MPCSKTSQAFSQVAADYEGVGLFFNVQFEDAKPFVKACGVKAAPVTQIYAQGVLTHAQKAGPGEAWTAFEANLEQVSSAISA